jgi:hypothetical protein
MRQEAMARNAPIHSEDGSQLCQDARGDLQIPKQYRPKAGLSPQPPRRLCQGTKRGHSRVIGTGPVLVSVMGQCVSLLVSFPPFNRVPKVTDHVPLSVFLAKLSQHDLDRINGQDPVKEALPYRIFPHLPEPDAGHFCLLSAHLIGSVGD